MKNKIRIKVCKDYFSAEGALYSGSVVITNDKTWPLKEIVKVTDLSGKIYRLPVNNLSKV
jgi:hypothetical protein|tara:strand:- start:2922 stop:3101 length:180 start_codon:yes stop_codon:yes gene_type:complete